LKPIVFGGTGFIGSHTVEQLCLAGHGVTVVLREGADATFLQSLDVAIKTIDFASDEALADVIKGHDVVYCCLATTRMHQSLAQRLAIEVTLIGRVFMAASVVGANRFVQLSTVHVYGFCHGSTAIDEDTPKRVVHGYGKAALARENHLLKLAADSKTELVLIRPAETHGLRDKVFASFKAMHQQGYYVVIGDGRVRVSGVDVRDVGRAMVWCGTLPEAAGNSYLVQNFSFCQLEFKHIMDELQGRRARLIRLPLVMVKTFATVLERMLPYSIEVPLTPFAVAVVTTSCRYDDSKLRSTGFQYQYGLVDMIRASLGF
jgi:nucleoside-diphosphate-sugar epimerase